MHKTLISEMIVTKVCHDLAAPIGAVYNGVEFLEEEGSVVDLAESPAYQLIVANAKSAMKKLKFFRYIYGNSTEIGEADLNALSTLLIEFYEDTKITLQFDQNNFYVGITHRAAKLLLVLCYICSMSLIYGGVLNVSIKDNRHGKKVTISGFSEKEMRQVWDMEAISADSECAGMRVNNVPVYLAGMLAAQLQVDLKSVSNKHEIMFEFSFDQ